MKVSFIEVGFCIEENLEAAAFKTLVWPKLEYAAPLWVPYHQADINRIEKVQRTAAR